MSLKVFSAGDLPKDRWSSLTDNSIYSSPEFAAVWCTMGGRELFLAEELGGRIVAGMAGNVFGRKIFRRFQSMPDGISGGPFFADDCTLDQRGEFLHSVYAWLKNEKIIKADIHDPCCKMDTNLFRLHRARTHVISLDTENFRPPDEKISKHIRAAKRREGTLGVISSREQLAQFYELVGKTERQHGVRPRYPREFFERLIEIALDDERIYWPVVFEKGRMIGSRICFIESSRIFSWQHYHDRAFSHLKPGYLLLDHIINYAREKNLKSLNLGWSPPGAASLIEYKERWGAEGHFFDSYTYLSGIGRAYYGWRLK
jgi:hypothetical protein